MVRGVPELDAALCYRALQTRDARFDGRFFVGVLTTGIYCRPVCPARTARRENVRFYPSAAAAQEAGFRPCLRCRPETAPEHGAWRGTSNTVSRGLALIARGELDGDGASVEQLAERLGVGERQLRRLFEQHLGASPNAVAQTRRVLFAKQLLHETALSMSEQKEKGESKPLKNDPPKIVFSTTPAILILIDGAPAYRPVSGTAYSRVVNTRPLVLKDSDGTHYLRVFDGWMTAPALTGPWRVPASVRYDLDPVKDWILKSTTVDLLTDADPKDPNNRPSLAKGPVPAIVVTVRFVRSIARIA